MARGRGRPARLKCRWPNCKRYALGQVGKWCEAHGKRRMLDNIEQMRKGKGPHAMKWARRILSGTAASARKYE